MAVFYCAKVGKQTGHEHTDELGHRAVLAAKKYIENASQYVTFPRLFTLYFASVDHSCHLLGLKNPSFGVLDVQAAYLGKIDMEVYHVIKAYKQHFPAEFDSTVFIITSDHGHAVVDPHKFVSTKDVWNYSMLAGPWEIDGPWRSNDSSSSGWAPVDNGHVVTKDGIVRLAHIAGNGRMKHVYVTAKNRKELIVAFLGNLCYAQKQFAGSPLKEDRSILMVLGRLPGGKYQQFKVVKKKEWQGPFLAQSGTTDMILDPYVLVSDPLPKQVSYINPMLNSETRSGDILILANQEKQWQFVENKPRAMGMGIPLLLDQIRIPFSESFNSSSTHGSVNTMDVPLVFFGKPIPGDATIPSANVVDIVPTILNMFGLPIPRPMDGEPLLDHKLKPYVLLGKVKFK